MSPRLRALGRGLALAVRVCALVLVALAAGFLAFIYSLPREPLEAGERTDAIVVLTGGSERLSAGVELLAAGLAGVLYISGVHPDVDRARIQKVTGLAPGRFDCCIELGYAAASTAGNALETAQWIRSRQVRSVRLVTAHYHMPRSLLEFRAALPDVRIVPHPVAPPRVRLDAWWRHPGTATLLAAEYLKFIAAGLRVSIDTQGHALFGSASP
ncbi:MAG TPA: YdcF family protein [Azospirillaceae bacterium]|nr:YdcF family protein [Azospirillaceae bacterium]